MEFVAENRKIESLGAFYDQLTPAQRDALVGVAMGMWEAYIQATRTRYIDAYERISGLSFADWPGETVA